MSKRYPRTLYAPNPAGLLLGNARTALFSYLTHAIMVELFIIRIEDTDRKRHVEDGERVHSLKIFSLVGN